jgi:hypothetical protein
MIGWLVGAFWIDGLALESIAAGFPSADWNRSEVETLLHLFRIGSEGLAVS